MSAPKSTLKKIVLGSLPLVALFAAWQLLASQGWVDPVFLPTIPQVFHALFTVFSRDNYLTDVWISIYRVLGAFAASAVLAVPIGLLAGRYVTAAELVEPAVGFVRYLPVPAFVPLCILWFGLGDLAKMVVIFLGTFFQMILLVADVARSVPREYFDAALTLGASRRELFWRILWRASLPGVVSACRTAVGWAWTYLVVAEIAGATSGIGFRILQAQRYIETPKVFAGIVIIGLLGLTTDLLFQAFHNWRFHWL